MNLSQVRRELDEARVDPVKTLGQNFLHDQNLARAIVAGADLGPGDFVVEIGPGLGALTEQILASGARVLALEKDARLVEALRHKFSSPQLEIRHMDALDFDVRELFPEKNAKVIGNLPYYIASQLLIKFVNFPTSNILALFMLQDEMARRIVAGPESEDYGALSLRIQLHHSVEYLRKIPASVFLPQPEVDSAILRIKPRRLADAAVADFRRARKLIRLGFSQRRKQLQKLLRADVENWELIAREINCSPTARAEELSRQQWIALSNFAAISDGRTTADELFPVVDENDEQTGTATRGEVHENNLRHRAVHLLLFNDKGEVLLQKRSAGKDRHPLLWDSSAAGHVDAGETYDDAAARELMEELGVRADLKLTAKLPASEGTGQEFICLYLASHNGPFSYPASEITAVEFFPPAAVERWTANKPEEFAPGFLECWKVWRATPGSRQPD